MSGKDPSAASPAALADALAAEPSPLRRRQMLMAARAFWDRRTVILFADETLRRIFVDLPQAERMARAAHWLAGRLGDDEARAAGFRAMGHIMQRKRRYQAALTYYQQSVEIYERLGQELEIGRTLNSSLQSMIYLGRYEAAIEAARRCEQIFTRLGDHVRLARLQANLGNIMHRQDRFDEALDLYRRAYASMAAAGEPRDVAVTLQNMATCQIGMNDFHDALETYQRAREYSMTHQLPLLVAVADYNIAYLHYLHGEYTRAIEGYRAAREHCRTIGDVYREALCDLDLSEMYVDLNLNEEGAHLARRAMAAFHKLGNLYEAAKALTNLAISLSHHGDSGQALSLFGKARELFTREGNRAWVATIDLYQALVFYQESKLTAARLLAESALLFFAPTSFYGKTILCRLLLARVHLDAGRAERARQICQEAVAVLETAESPALSYQAYFVMGSIEEVLGREAEARQSYLTAHRHLENLRSHLRSEDTKVAFLKNKLEIYEALVRMSLRDPPDPRQAFIYIEQAKSRSLADLIAFRAHDLPASGGSRELVEQVQALRGELNWYNRAIPLQESREGNVHTPRTERLRRRARDCERRLVEAMAGLRVEDTEFVALQGAGSIDLDAIRSVLPAGAMLLEYYQVGDTFHACLLSGEKLKIVPLSAASELRRALQLLRFQLSKFRLGAEYVNTFREQLVEATQEHLRHFYKHLIAPIAGELDAEHLIIAPHDFLHYLPFHALLDGSDYLGSRYSISYTPSASVYYLCCAKSAGTGDGALVLGVPDPSAPQIRQEVEAVASVLANAETFVGGAATLEVLRERGAHARYLHIATHGSFRQDNPMFSSISLGNSQLSLFDLYQLRLPCELVTLSGCGTGLNVVVGGDELMGLKRGLLYAGARGLLLTLWDVHDESTAEFMKLFYGELGKSGNKARAVQHAMAELRRAYTHPFYWAPFVLVGQYA